jgi:very-short-patch-repair endonuclease
VTDHSRRAATDDGQLLREFRGRDLSGLPFDRLSALADLISSVGPPCWAWGPTAAALHRFDGFALRPPFHVVVPRGRNVHRVGHVVHTTEDLEPLDLETAADLPTCAPARTLIDLSRMTDGVRLTKALDSAIRDGLLSEDLLHHRIGELRSQGKHGIPLLLEVIEGSEVERGGQSWLERRFLRLLAHAGLPRPMTQQVLGRRGTRLVRVDFRFPDTAVIVETLGYRWHRTGAQMAIDAERMNELTISGFLVLQFTYRQIVDDPGAVVAAVSQALAAAPRLRPSA